MNNPTMGTFKARVEEPGSGVLTKTIEAAYFAPDANLIEFKDDDHKTVYAIRHDCLLSVERVVESVAAQSDAA